MTSATLASVGASRPAARRASRTPAARITCGRYAAGDGFIVATTPSVGAPVDIVLPRERSGAADEPARTQRHWILDSSSFIAATVSGRRARRRCTRERAVDGLRVDHLGGQRELPLLAHPSAAATSQAATISSIISAAGYRSAQRRLAVDADRQHRPGSSIKIVGMSALPRRTGNLPSGAIESVCWCSPRPSRTSRTRSRSRCRHRR